MTSIEAESLRYIAKREIINYCFIPTPGWAKVWVEAEQPIPEIYKSEFYDELVSEDPKYKKSLEESIRYFGVRWR